MKTYKAKVEQGEDGWLVAEVTALSAFTGRPGSIATQGRDLDELAYMARDAIELITDESNFAIQLLVPPTVKTAASRSRAPAKKRRRAAA